jgi:hypothetical protein
VGSEEGEVLMQRLSVQQRIVLDTKGVKLLGQDENGRPVVEQMAGIPHQLRRWAIKPDGDPADIKGTVTNPLDRWFEAISRHEPCPACGAGWRLSRRGKGAEEMTHRKGCAYVRLLEQEGDN